MFDLTYPDIIIQNAKWESEDSAFTGDIRIRHGRIAELDDRIAAGKKNITIDVQHHFIYPGLINAHDHLEMNLYPKLGNPPYSNYVDWAKGIYQPKASPIREIEKIDVQDRLLWGGLKNLVSGSTTVIHHNPWNRIFSSEKFPVKVLRKMSWAHSHKLGTNIEKAFPENFDTPFIIHAAEGLDELASNEIAELNNAGLIKKNTVLVHGVGMSEQDVKLLKQVGSALVWCPASNLFLFNRTVAVDKIKSEIPIALGTDSTLTGSPTILDEMRLAANSGMATQADVYRMVSKMAEMIFKLEPTNIQVNSPADLFCLPVKQEDYIENLFAHDASGISLVTVNGVPKLLDNSFANPFHKLKYKVNVLGRSKAVYLDVASLKSRIEKKVPAHYLERNPLWTMII